MTSPIAPRLGMSVYLSESEVENLARMSRAVEHRVSVLFTSLHIPEDANVEAQPRLLRRLAEEARDIGRPLYADISPTTLRRLRLGGSGAVAQILTLATWDVAGVRFDDGFDMATVAEVSQHMGVQINASTVTDDVLSQLESHRADLRRIEALHNFYPRPDTGLGFAAYGRMNARLRAEGLGVGAFAPGDGILRGPLRVGLPTCEDHRGMDPVQSAVALWRGPAAGEGADSVYVGDIDLTQDTWRRLSHLADGVVPVRWEPSPGDETERRIVDVLGAHPATNRIDAAERVIRLREFRPMIGEASLMAARGQALPSDSPGAGRPRPRGCVTVDNDDYGRYAGEVQVTLVDLPADPRVTVLGQVVRADLPMLDLVGPGGKTRLLRL